MGFKECLRARRSELGLTQEAVAKAAGMNVTQYNGYERGRSAASPATLPRLAKALQTTPGTLLGQMVSTASARRGAEARREMLQRLKASFQEQVAAELELAPADICIRIEIL